MTWNGPTIGVMRPGMLAVSGCRPPLAHHNTIANWAIYDSILMDVRKHVGSLPSFRIVHGGAQGVDKEASEESGRLGAERYLPNYALDGKAAPMIRNAYVTTTERFCAWPAPWSRGTWDAVKKRLNACGADGFEMRIVGFSMNRVPKDVVAAMLSTGAKATLIRAWTTSRPPT